MEPYSATQEHDPSNITLLCSKHHDEKTKGLLPITSVRAANDEPHNLTTGTSDAYLLHFSGASAEIDVGSNITFTNGHETAAVMIDGVPLVGFRFEDGSCLLSLLIFNRQNEPILQVVDNELVYSTSPWDVEFVGKTLTIRTAQRDIAIEIRFEPPNRVAVKRGAFLLNGVELYVRPEYALLVNNRGLFQRNTAFGCLVNLNLGFDTRNLGAAVRWSSIPRYGVDRAAALEWAHQKVSFEP
ncbi:hypothetical protein BHQ17_27645 [Mycolicibacterium holsaticum]|uniref:HNH endonuclease n=1 Tax=Mycolicibacterium holsaticum TaxID=152142 RepID=A0A1E3R380_9MYCO|nr:hypothetical protein BHQ17_27645 [Mycolicibacterium holsaticum]